MLDFSIPGDPTGKARPRFGRGHTYTPSATVAYEHAVAWSAKAAGARPLPGAVSVDIRAYFQLPKRVHVAKGIFPTAPCLKKPDADNIGKIICDGLNGVAYDDDSQVSSLTVRKEWAEIPRVDVTVRYATPG